MGGFFVCTMNKNNATQDLIIIGGGVMGLMTAYYASAFVKNITILEKKTIDSDNKDASSFSFTRSIHKDYLDPQYISLAAEAQILWRELQQKSDKPFFFECGSLGIAKKSVTPDLADSYAEKSHQTKVHYQFSSERFPDKEIKKRYPQFDADLGILDKQAGYIHQPTVYTLLLQLLKEKGIIIKENVVVTSIVETNNGTTVETENETLLTKKVVITAGRWLNDVVSLVKKNILQFPITLDKPQENKYYYPSKEVIKNFYPDKFPVFAFLDVGIYGHPVFDKKRAAIKIGYYNPTDMVKKKSSINSIAEFVEQCMPMLKDAPNEDVNDADHCSYDLVGDDNFIIGKLPGFQSIIVGGGWRGTGYKFAPLIGKMLGQMVLRNETVYNIQRFSPERFVAK
jgi:N-methyl-L-tryptophan oxidase